MNRIRNFVAKYATRCGAGRHAVKVKYNRKQKHRKDLS